MRRIRSTDDISCTESTTDNFRNDVWEGLSRKQKTIPCKYLYDKRGSELFEEICEQDEYYLTRTELAITRDNIAAIAERIGDQSVLIELGSGSSLKTRVLLDYLKNIEAYVPIDISREMLHLSAAELALRYEHLDIRPVCADFNEPIDLPLHDKNGMSRVAYVPGSTIGNLTRDGADAFLKSIRRLVGPGGGLLIGADLQKDAATIEAAYNDQAGVTEAFNKNLLRRINRELDGDFDSDKFRHHAFYDGEEGRVEIHLESAEAQEVSVCGKQFDLERGETIRTEYSHKYSLEGFAKLAGTAGFTVEQVWTDDNNLFSVQFLTAQE